MDWTKLPALLVEAGIATDDQAERLAEAIRRETEADGDAWLRAVTTKG